LRAYRWLESDYEYPARPTEASLQIEFLEKQDHGITSWLIVAPQRRISFGSPLRLTRVADFAVKNRRRVDGRRFQIFGEPGHRSVAEFIAGIDTNKRRLTVPDPATKALRDKRRGVFLFYPVREKEGGKVSIGFELLFPENRLPFDINFTVRRKAESARVVVRDPDSD
jgi:hypothetical protein